MMQNQVRKIVSELFGPVVFLTVVTASPGNAQPIAIYASAPVVATPQAVCAVDALRDWSEAERWVWQQVCSGLPADLNERYGEELDPSDRSVWPEERKIGSLFLETILLHEPFKSAQKFRGVRIFGAWFDEPIDLEHGSFEYALWLRKSRFDEPVVLRRTTARLPLALTGSWFYADLDLVGIDAQRGLWLDQGSFESIDLRGTHVSGRLSLENSRFNGSVQLLTTKVDASLLLTSSIFMDSVRIVSSDVGYNLDLSGSVFSLLDLTGSTVGGELRLGSNTDPETRWDGEKLFVLQDVEVNVLEDLVESWPNDLSVELSGFTYVRFGRSHLGDHSENVDQSVDGGIRAAEWYVDWLAKDESYAPQPYTHLASVLEAMGERAEARDIRYANKDRSRAVLKEKGLWGAWLWASSQWLVIGYGYNLEFTFYWLIALILLGSLVLRITGEGERHLMPYGLAYSADMLIPLIEFSMYHYEKVQLRGPARYYFYFHRLLGYVLAYFLVAGMTGLVE